MLLQLHEQLQQLDVLQLEQLEQLVLLLQAPMASLARSARSSTSNVSDSRSRSSVRTDSDTVPDQKCAFTLLPPFILDVLSRDQPQLEVLLLQLQVLEVEQLQQLEHEQLELLAASTWSPSMSSSISNVSVSSWRSSSCS